ncbi:MAG: Lon-like protease helical domain-containing protein [Flavobacteriaceae bacterium]
MVCRRATQHVLRGQQNAGKTAAVKAFLEEKAANEPGPDDWVYVYNFGTPHKPRALHLPSGRAQQLSKSLEVILKAFL